MKTHSFPLPWRAAVAAAVVWCASISASEAAAPLVLREPFPTASAYVDPSQLIYFPDGRSFLVRSSHVSTNRVEVRLHRYSATGAELGVDVVWSTAVATQSSGTSIATSYADVRVCTDGASIYALVPTKMVATDTNWLPTAVRLLRIPLSGQAALASFEAPLHSPDAVLTGVSDRRLVCSGGRVGLAWARQEVAALPGGQIERRKTVAIRVWNTSSMIAVSDATVATVASALTQVPEVKGFCLFAQGGRWCPSVFSGNPRCCRGSPPCPRRARCCGAGPSTTD